MPLRTHSGSQADRTRQWAADAQLANQTTRQPASQPCSALLNTPPHLLSTVSPTTSSVAQHSDPPPPRPPHTHLLSTLSTPAHLLSLRS